MTVQRDGTGFQEIGRRFATRNSNLAREDEGAGGGLKIPAALDRETSIRGRAGEMDSVGWRIGFKVPIQRNGIGEGGRRRTRCRTADGGKLNRHHTAASKGAGIKIQCYRAWINEDQVSDGERVRVSGESHLPAVQIGIKGPADHGTARSRGRSGSGQVMAGEVEHGWRW